MAGFVAVHMRIFRIFVVSMRFVAPFACVLAIQGHAADPARRVINLD